MTGPISVLCGERGGPAASVSPRTLLLQSLPVVCDWLIETTVWRTSVYQWCCSGLAKTIQIPLGLQIINHAEDLVGAKSHSAVPASRDNQKIKCQSELNSV